MEKIAFWIDDVRPVPFNYYEVNKEINHVIWAKSVNEAINTFLEYTLLGDSEIVLFDLDHDAGIFAKDGGDYIRILDWLERAEFDFRNCKWKIHSMNPVGIQNMRRIIEKNGGRLY